MVAPQLRASGGKSLDKRHRGFEFSWGMGRCVPWHRQKERRRFPLGGREEKQRLPGKGQDPRRGCQQHPLRSAGLRAHAGFKGRGREDKDPCGVWDAGRGGARSLGEGGSTWVSSPVHPDKLMGTCQRQNGWCECWQHEAQCQTQTLPHCGKISRPSERIWLQKYVT